MTEIIGLVQVLGGAVLCAGGSWAFEAATLDVLCLGETKPNRFLIENRFGFDWLTIGFLKPVDSR